MIKLLLADDEAIIREGLISMIPWEELHLSMTASCANAFDALDSIADDMPDILISDIKMPQMNGLELIQRALQFNPSMQCIVLSGYDDFAFAKKALQLGVREYLLKPCARRELQEVLERVCAGIEEKRRIESSSAKDFSDHVRNVAQELETMMFSGREITGEYIASWAEAQSATKALRAAYTYLLAHHEIDAEYGFTAIKQAYAADENMPSVVAEGLKNLQEMLNRPKNFVDKMCDYIQKNYGEENLSLQYLADRVVFLRADYIGREFTRKTGMKLSTYLMQIRMEKAKELLASSRGEMPVYEVAEQIGLGHNPQYFSQLFRKYTGKTPKEYSKKE